ncbi:ribosome small subunit-dependent GTPase A [Pseudofrankia asymbiotica]|uniref:Small ribosomal subunit biogenesis GTPase RsgA n=1 Tax=Pseudofrankia asymbiotica TaxID=1834516 RepID=A0A1V2I5V2_9ACTN|nr:ribosome small subunit-dependent GTPase A [Pseudofrankia asymbiotica]
MFASHRAAGLVPGRITRVDRGACEVVTAVGRSWPATVPAGPVGTAPCTGDWAALRPAPVAGAAGHETLTVAALLPRRTALVRASASRRSDPQPLAANVDIVAVAVALTAPINLGRLERLVTLAWESGARPLVVLTKADQAGGAWSETARTAEAEAAAAAPGVDVVTTSAADGTGLDVLAALLTGTSVLIGTSGTGKSTLTNALLGAEAQRVRAVRSADGKGRHTTVRRELLPLPGGGVLIDTPGLRGVGLWAAENGLSQAFADVEELAAGCRFGDCEHRTEPGCAVLAAVDDGTMPARRLASYRRLLRENAHMAARGDARLRAEQERQWRTISKEQRRMYRERGR